MKMGKNAEFHWLKRKYIRSILDINEKFIEIITTIIIEYSKSLID
jgi:hypothetical protein